ncbi:hypothetical protein [Roseibium sp. RKSG952]|uniref:hypothetical protein n=1 Tax=Roseibium sp. RKSG952 TaxID=2529384 RepID=UPI0012BC2C4B|nr:hypothetical protein [Roseibium sp. RKSG952]MTH96424.1 hypothetical protein [Roseibium sp. RKSG952]
MAKRLFAFASACAISLPVAGAGQEAAIYQQALSCWSPPISIGEQSFRAAVSFNLNNKGEVLRGRVDNYQPSGKVGLRFAKSAISAIERCQPYDVSGAQFVQLIFEYPPMRIPKWNIPSAKEEID